MRGRFLDDLVAKQAATPAQIAVAQSWGADKGSLVQRLLLAGAVPERLLAVLCSVANMPAAPRMWLQKPTPLMLPGLSASLCRSLRILPMNFEEGTVHIAVSDPAAAQKLSSLGWPPHRAYLALERDILEGLAKLFPGEIEVPPAVVAAPTSTPASASTSVSTPVQPTTLPPVAATPFPPLQPAPAVDAPTMAMSIGDRSRLQAVSRLDAPEVATPFAPLGAMAMNTSPAVGWQRSGAPTPFNAAPSTPFGATPFSNGSTNPASSPMPPMMNSAPLPATVPAHGASSPFGPLPVASSGASAFSSSPALPPMASMPSALPSAVPPTMSPPMGVMGLPPPATMPTMPATPSAQAFAQSQMQNQLQNQASASSGLGHVPAAASPAMPHVMLSGGAAAQAILQKKQIGPYVIDRILGRGGMATVFFAVDQKTQRQVALKIMDPGLVGDEDFVERFQRESRSSSQLEHENVVRVFDFGQAEGFYFMACEYIDSGTLKDLIRALGKVPAALAVVIAAQVLRGLKVAHDKGIIHRDLKPANLLLSKSGHVKIGDFGIAKTESDATLTKTGSLYGTPAYMSPEQAHGEKIDTRSDLFSVGTLFYQMVTGVNPFHAENPSASLLKVYKAYATEAMVVEPTIPEQVERVLRKLMEKNPDERYQNASEALHDLQPLLDYIDQQYPNLLGTALNDASTSQKLRQDQAQAEFRRAEALLQQLQTGRGDHAPEATFALYRASLLTPNDQNIRQSLDEVMQKYKFSFVASKNDALLAVDKSLGDPTQQVTLAVLRRTGDSYRAEGNLLHFAAYYKRYLRYRPQDTYAQHQVSSILGKNPCLPFAAWSLESSSPTQVPASMQQNHAANPSSSGHHTNHAAATERAEKTPASSAQSSSHGSSHHSGHNHNAAAGHDDKELKDFLAALSAADDKDGVKLDAARLEGGATKVMTTPALSILPALKEDHKDDGNSTSDTMAPIARERVVLSASNTSQTRAQAMQRKKNMIAAASVVVVLLLVSGIAWAWSQGQELSPEEQLVTLQTTNLNEGTSLLGKKEYQKAIIAFSKVIDADPKTDMAVQALLSRGRAQCGLGSPNEAKADFESVMRDAPPNDPAFKAARTELSDLAKCR